MNNKWIFFVSKRFAQVDRSGRFAITSFLASVSICFGVMTLIAVMSVMNGFQLGFIDSIMEISSAHIRITPLENFNQNSFSNFCFENRDEIVAVEPFYEAQSLMASSKGKQTASLIRAVSPTIMYTDTGFAKEIQMISGSFDLHRQDSIVLGSDLARILGVKIGDKVNLLALSGGSDVDLISENRVFFVTGIFSCGYAEINSTYSFISLDAAKKFFGEKKHFALCRSGIFAAMGRRFTTCALENGDVHTVLYEENRTIYPREGRTYCLSAAQDRYHIFGTGRYTIDYRIFYMNGRYYEYGSKEISQDKLYEYSNFEEIYDEAIKQINAEELSTNMGETIDYTVYPYVCIDNVMCNSENGDIIINFRHWLSSEVKAQFDAMTEDEKDNALFECQIPCHPSSVIFGVNGSELEIKQIDYGVREPVGTDFEAVYPE